jgi:hypothetical protein
MLKTYVRRFKNGLYLAADSFAMLWQHPILLMYYFSLLLTYTLIFIFAYNLIGYRSAYLQLSHEFHTPQNNLLADLLPQTGGLVYLGFIFSIFLNILLRTCVGIALIQHTHALLHGHKPIIREIYIATKNRFLHIFSWSLLITGVTLLISAPCSSASRVQSALLQILCPYLGITWLLLSFFVMPVIALTRKTISQAIYTSAQLITSSFLEILGGLFWISLIYLFTFLTNILVDEYLVSSAFKDIYIEHNVTIFNTLFATILLIFKTRMFHTIIPLKHPA